jgi:hypothetical protein
MSYAREDDAEIRGGFRVQATAACGYLRTGCSSRSFACEQSRRCEATILLQARRLQAGEAAGIELRKDACRKHERFVE